MEDLDKMTWYEIIWAKDEGFYNSKDLSGEGEKRKKTKTIKVLNKPKFYPY